MPMLRASAAAARSTSAHGRCGMLLTLGALARPTQMPSWPRLCLAGMDVELRHLRAFVAVARLSSFTKASEQLLITQPALSRTVQQLEAALQVALLDRTSRRVGLTAAGREFLGHAERVLADLDIALASVRGQVTVRLGFSWLLPDPWAQRTVARFEQA